MEDDVCGKSDVLNLFLFIWGIDGNLGVYKQISTDIIVVITEVSSIL